MKQSCVECGEVKTIIAKGLCNNCYHRHYYNEKNIKLKRRKEVKKCLLCGKNLRNVAQDYCKVCRTTEQVLLTRLAYLKERIVTCKRNIAICQQYNNSNGKHITFQKVAEQYSISRQKIQEITSQGAEYQQQRLLSYKQQYSATQEKLTNFRQILDNHKNI